MKLNSLLAAIVLSCVSALPLQAFGQCVNPTPLPNGLPPCLQAIRPVVDCVQPNQDGSYTAKWGYESDNASCCPAYELPIRTEGVPEDPRANFFTPAPIDRGQPSTFLPGVHHEVFTTTWDGSPLSWTLRYYNLTPPLFYAESTVTAVSTNILNYCSTDCLGVPNGNAVFDRCGVCDGNGESCLGCISKSISPVQFALDSGAQHQAALTVNALYRYRRVAGSSKTVVRYIAKVRKEASELATLNWVTTWSFPGVYVNCTNTDFCVSTSTTSLSDAYRSNNDALLNLTLDVVKRILRKASLAPQKAAARRVRKFAQELHDLNVTNLATIPNQFSRCSS